MKTTEVLLVLLAMLPLNAYAQGKRDQQALDILSKCIAATGNIGAITSIQDFSAVGQITYYWGDDRVQADLVLKGRGDSQFRMDAVLSDGTRSWAVSNGEGVVLDPNGTRTTIPYYNAVNIGILSWRIPNMLTALRDTSIDISYVGLVHTDVGDEYQIHVQQTDPLFPDPKLATVKAVDYLIDSKTLLLLRVSTRAYSASDLVQEYAQEVSFADYKAIDGIFFPFSLSETINGQQTWSAVLSSVTLNAGLTDKDFGL